MKPVFQIGLAIFSLMLANSLSAMDLEITAGAQPLLQSVITIEAPEELPANPALQAADGKSIPLQTDPDGNVTFILPNLQATTTASFKLVSLTDVADPIATATPGNDIVELSIAGKSVASYQTTARSAPRPNLDPLYLRGGYLHPILTPAGKVVTDDYAVNHLHHHGIWTAWTRANYDGRDTDFWNMGQGKGRVDFVSLEKSWSGPVHAGFISKQRFTDLTSGKPVDVLDEKWTVRIYAIDQTYRLIDLASEQTIIGDKPLHLPEYHYGGIGLRGRGEWDGKNNAMFLNSEAVSDRIKINSQSTKWIRMTGNIDGSAAGIAILSHPENFRAPQPARVHPSEPFISIAPQVGGAMEIKPGETYQMKYRFVVSDGPADAKLLDSLWEEYAHPFQAKWKD